VTVLIDQHSRRWRLGGFDAFAMTSALNHPREGPSLIGQRVLIVPWWFLTAVAGLLPLTWMIRHKRRAARAAARRCPSCGYDLRATPDRCPECGTPAKAVTT
jgi:hypothetical protein